MPLLIFYKVNGRWAPVRTFYNYATVDILLGNGPFPNYANADILKGWWPPFPHSSYATVDFVQGDALRLWTFYNYATDDIYKGMAPFMEL